MPASTYTSIHLAQRPKDKIIPGETFKLKSNEVPKESDLKDGEVLLQSLYLSLDPAMRGWMNGELNLQHFNFFLLYYNTRFLCESLLEEVYLSSALCRVKGQYV